MTAHDEALITPGRHGTRTSDIAYCDADPSETRGNLLDIYEPSVSTAKSTAEMPGPYPVIIWSSGSAWMRDDGKHGATHVAELFNPLGYVVVGLSIRSSAQVQFPGQLFDIRAAIRWLRAHADSYGIDPERIAIMGNSSGGWVASMAATTSSIEQFDNEPPTGGVSSAVQAAVAFFPPIDFLEMDRHTIVQKQTYGLRYLPTLLHDDERSPESRLVGGAIQNQPDKATAANPVGYIDGSEPPMLVFHGTADPLLPPAGSESLYVALRGAGSVVSYTAVSDGGHVVDPAFGNTLDLPGGPIIGAKAFTVRSADAEGNETIATRPPPTWETIAAFLDATLSGNSPSDL